MGHTVEITEPGAEPRRVRIDGAVEVGREGVELLLADAAVSRRHFRLRSTATGLTVEDLGSTNGTVLNDKRVERETQVAPGDVVRAGDTKLILVAARAPAAPEPPKTRALPLASIQVGRATISYRAGGPGEQAAPGVADDVRTAQRRLERLVPRNDQASISVRLVDPMRDPSGSGEMLTAGTFIDAAQQTVWLVVTAESPPEPIARALAVLLAAALPAGRELALLLEAYGLFVDGIPENDDALRGVDLPPMATADGASRAAMLGSFARFLVGLSSERDFVELLRTTPPGGVDRAVSKLYGRGLAGLEQRWRQQLAIGAPNVKTAQFLRLAGKYLRPHVRREAEMFIYMLAGLGFTVVFPFAFRQLLDKALPSRDFNEALSIIGLLSVALAVSLLAGLRRAYLSAYVSSAVVREIRGRMFERLQQMHIGWFTQRQQGDVLARLLSDVGLLEAGLSQTLRDGAFQVLSLIVSATVLIILNPLLAAIVLVGAPLVAGIYRLMAKGAQRRSIAVQDETGVVVGIAAENYAAQTVVKAYGLERQQGERFGDASARLFRKQMGLQLFGGLFGLSVNMIVTGLRLAVLTLGAWLILHDHLTVGGLVAFMGLMGEAISPVTVLTGIGQQIQASTGALARINEILEVTPEVSDDPQAVPLPPLREGIVFENVSFAYAAGSPTLQTINLDIAAGSRIALVGPSGAGKSSLLQLLMRLYDPSQGAVRFDGHDIRGVTLSSLRAQLGAVFQDTFLFEGTLRDNVLAGKPDATSAEVATAVTRAELSEFVETLPDGLDTLVGERGARLSGGQRQRVAIARALIRDPRVLILDEATSALDPRTEAMLTETLTKVSRGRTTIAVTHRLTSVADYDRIIVLSAGQIVEQGTHDELLARHGLYATLWAEQTGIVSSARFDARAALTRTAVFATATDDVLDTAAALLRAEPLSVGTRLSEDSTRLVFVGDGEANLLAPGLDGGLTQIARLDTGDAFGVGAVLGQPAGLVLEAKSAVTLFVLDSAALRQLTASSPAVAAALRGGAEAEPVPAAAQRLSRLVRRPVAAAKSAEATDHPAEEARRLSGAFKSVTP